MRCLRLVALILALTVCTSGAAQQGFPAPSVSQAPDDAFRAAYTTQQRLELEMENAAFSADGRYLALVVSNIVTGDPEQAWRYDLLTHQFLAVTAKPNEDNEPEIDGIAWIGNVLYTAVTDRYHGGRKLFYKTEGDVTSPIASPPPEAHWPDYSLPRKVGPYTVDGTPITAAVTKLFMSPSGAPITQVFWVWWVTLDDPPTVFSATGSINVFNLSTRHVQHITVPTNYGLEVLAALRIPKGFRVAYKIQGSCTIAESSPNQRRPRSLCFVDIPEETGPNHSRPLAKK